MHTLEPVIEALREDLLAHGWSMSGAQKTTSYEFDGPWSGASTRSAYLFFHRGKESGPSLEAFLDETDDDLQVELSLVVRGPNVHAGLDLLGLLDEAAERYGGCLPEELKAPVSLSLRSPGRPSHGAAVPASPVRTGLRFKCPLPRPAISAGRAAFSATVSTVAKAFGTFLEEEFVQNL